jgi:hypothetical protein
MNWKTYHTKELKEKYLLKFVPISRLEEFIRSGEIWFSRADIFGDNLECIRISDLQNNSLNHGLIEKRQKRRLISCWHLADTESVAMWDTYSVNKEERKNIAIRFERKTLVKLIEDNLCHNLISSFELIHGKVQYKNLINYKEKRLSRAKVKYTAFRKENAFTYENEYRLVIKGNDCYDIDGFGYKIGQPEHLTFDILINPLLKKEITSELKNKIHNLGFGKNIKDSELNAWFQLNEN